MSTDRVSIDLAGFIDADGSMQSRLVLLAMMHLNGSARDVSSEHVSTVRDLAKKPVGKRLDLPGGTVWRREPSRIVAFHPAASVEHVAPSMPGEAVPLWCRA